MKLLPWLRSWLIVKVFVCAVLLGVVPGAISAVMAQEGDVGSTALNVPGYSSPIAFGGGAVWVVNPDDDSISLIDIATDTLARRIFVGDEPQSIALAINNDAYVANAAEGTVTVINFGGNINNAQAVKTLTTGAEPWNVVARPDGAFVYVANSGQDTITVINTASRTIASVFNIGSSACNVGDTKRHFQPRGLAVTGNGDFLFVTRFLSFTKPGGVQGDDTGKEGIVCRLAINAGSGALSSPTAIVLPAQDAGFAATINDTPTPTSAYPNQLQSIVICGNDATERAYLPNIAASPDAPLRFNVDTQAFVNQIGSLAGTPASLGAKNLHLAARDPEPGKEKLFFANPWAIACDSPLSPTKAYVVSAGSDLLVKLNVVGGLLDFTVDTDTTRYIDLNDPANPATSGANAGKNPLGIVINDLGTKAYVMNYISRNVSVVDLGSDTVSKVIQTTPLPPPGSQEEQLHVGAEVFFSSRGVFDGGKVNRLSSEGWQNCASCHFAGLTDANIWIFGAGPRKSVPLNSSFSPHNPDDQRVLNYTAIFDEIQDFEANIRNVSGPGPLAGAQDPNHGLLIGDNGDINGAPGAVNAFAIPNTGRPQLTITLPGSNVSWPSLDALNEWVRFAIRTPSGALTDSELSSAGSPTTGGISSSQVNNGRRLFFQARCQVCHGGTKWTVSNKDFTSPPAGAEISTENPPVATAINSQYLNRFLSDIGTFNVNVAGQGNILPAPFNTPVGAIEKANRGNAASENGFDALGKDHSGDGKGNGFNIPGLLAVWQTQPYYHNGGCETLDCVLGNPAHRTVKNTLSDVLNTPAERDAVVAFLKTLDADTEFPLNLTINRHDVFLDPPTVLKGSNVTVGANISLFGTKADLANLLSDLGLGSVVVRFTFTTSAGPSSQEVSVAAADFNQDFGQATKTVSFSVPGDVGNSATVTVEVDSGQQLPETKENDNQARRNIRLFDPPPDRTPPVVNNVFISDDNPFNDNDQIATTRNVQVKIVATDPVGPAPQPTSGLKAFCLVRYSYDVVLRRWVEENCSFQSLPAPVAPDTFIVNTQLRPREGVGYVFAWVMDNEGNISRTPGFDFISFIPGNPINLNRNDVRLFRITTSSPLQFTFTPAFGDIDVAVFQGFNVGAARCAVSANNGSAAETVTAGSAPCTGTNFQIEVRAVTNSRFTITTAAGLTQTAAENEIGAAALSTIPTVAGPPALQTAIGDTEDLFLPVIVKN